MITGNGINCGSGGDTCELKFNKGTRITLSANPDSGYEFDR